MIKNEIDQNSTYVLEEERQRCHNKIWQYGVDNTDPIFVEYYRAICLELEYRDQNQPRATLHEINPKN